MDDKNRNELLRQLPSVSALLASKRGEQLTKRFGRGAVTFASRAELSRARSRLQKMDGVVPSEEEISRTIERNLVSLLDADGRRVINATGIILHTGLGRAPLSEKAGEAIRQCAGYSIVEVDRESGDRNRREENIESMLRELTGCEAATVVNNCAAAIFLALSASASPGEVILSRSELVEIGGSFRMPDVMEASGCRLREIGTTNRTSLEDYRGAITDSTTAILRVSQSNFRIRGFTSSPTIDEICALGVSRGIPVIYDLGGGSLVGLEEWGLSHETTVQEAIRAGVSIVCFSGDKLIGGPQAGILCGKKKDIEKARRNAFFRMFRPDKLTVVALEATLLSFLNGQFAEEIPVYRMIASTREELHARSSQLKDVLSPFDFLETSIHEDLAYLGGGSLPDEALPSSSIRIEHRSEDARHKNRWANTLVKNLRLSQPSVFCRIEAGGVVLNLRTVFSSEIDTLGSVLVSAIKATKEKMKD